MFSYGKRGLEGMLSQILRFGTVKITLSSSFARCGAENNHFFYLAPESLDQLGHDLVWVNFAGLLNSFRHHSPLESWLVTGSSRTNLLMCLALSKPG